MKPYLRLYWIVLLTLLFTGCRDKTTNTAKPADHPNVTTTINIELYSDTLVVDNARFHCQTEESQYIATILHEIALYQNKNRDMEHFVVKINVQEGNSRKCMGELDAILRQNHVTRIFYTPVKSKN